MALEARTYIDYRQEGATPAEAVEAAVWDIFYDVPENELSHEEMAAILRKVAKEWAG